MLSRYAVIQGIQVAQTAACNRLHDVEQRLARWLLMAQDRVDGGSHSDHARFSGDDAGDGPAEREPGGRDFAAEEEYRVHARGGEILSRKSWRHRRASAMG